MEESKNKNKQNWFMRHKVWTVIFVLVGLGFIQELSHGNDTTTSQNQPQNTPVPTKVVKQVPQRDIVLTSMIVKKVAPNTFRYFFNIANNDTQDFNGTVEVQLLNGHQDPQPLIWGGGNLDLSKSPIQAGANGVTYVDDSHGPQQVDGIDGATTFQYWVKVGDNEVASGKGNVSGEYENDLVQ